MKVSNIVSFSHNICTQPDTMLFIRRSFISCFRMLCNSLPHDPDFQRPPPPPKKKKKGKYIVGKGENAGNSFQIEIVKNFVIW